MVEAVAVHTFGLGGDSEVHLTDSGGVVIGPRRVVPLSLLAHQHPHIVDILQSQLANQKPNTVAGLFAMRQRPLEGVNTLSKEQRSIWDQLADGPMALSEILNDPRRAYFRHMALSQLVDRGVVVLAGLTPTDAAHVLGQQDDWCGEAARIGAEIAARRYNEINGPTDSVDGEPGPITGAESFCARVVRQVVVQSGRALLTAAIAEAHGVALDERDAVQKLFIERPLNGINVADSVLDVELRLRRPIVAIGAPVITYYPAVAERLHTRLCIPPHAGIANAVGAVAGGIMQTVHAHIMLLADESGFRVSLPTGIRDFMALDDAGAYAVEQAGLLVAAQAREAGAVDVQVHTERHDHIAHVRKDEHFEDIYIDSTVTASAYGRPRLGE
jgi:N-methylhydantoinase A/oxoprolinase/acetone carboxylase beta subunit